MTTFITVNKKSVRIEITDEEAKTKRNKMRYINKLQDAKADAYWADLKARGACPCCGRVLPLTKYCSNCQKTYK